ncbi:PREDICTED: uncharacterized protein LOC109584330 [Amphimedon queenslandica]|uniref:Death domain-containing protein n=1 Tax=Amphimedon queenslandica TaxID=400682 RepID=A0A1X7U8D6_AMPQE|nr:PREDICTED: uncharacterized protein LOC109584330 [Amphimedon queenslandica]|eukprot:XP_019855584.1 PREDICTED: uncharacterized protein LOC109584330 [Amphimedon queenslandica]
MSTTEEEEFQPSERDNHSTVRVGDNLYMWGGYQRSLTYEHGSDRKREITSVVEKFNLPTGKWEQKSTSNNPPLGVRGYASACIENEIFYFGGACNHDNCHHNSLHSLDVNTLKWKEVARTSSTSGPMQKRCGAMLALEFKKGDGSCLAVVGGYGPVNDNTPVQVGAMYSRDEADDSYQYCNEIHYYSLNKRQWLSPTVTGDRLPPISKFTLTPVTADSAILFGGITPDGPSNRLYTLKFKESEVEIREIPNPGGSDPWPTERDNHSSVLIDNGSSGPLLLVMGGMDMSDCWILDINRRSWKQLDTLEDDITERYDYSMSVYNVTPSISWVVVYGGIGGGQPWSILKDTNVLEIEYSNDELRVGAVPLDQYEFELNKKYIDKWCSEGSVELKLTRVQMLGHPGSGKTCAQHLLLNEDPPYYVPASNPSTSQVSARIAESSPTTESTPIACKAVKALRISIDDEGLQRVQSDDLLGKLAADLKKVVEKALADLQEKETEEVDYSLQPQESRATPDEERVAISNSEEAANTGSTGISDLRRNEDVRGIEDNSEMRQDSFSESPQKKFKASLEESDILENISNLITKAKATKLSREWVYIIDSGGQPAFQELLPLFTRAASLTLITLDISKDLEDEITIEYRIKGEAFSYDQEPVHTNLEVFKSAVSSGAIYQNPLVSVADHPNHSMFFILGTHFDVFKEKYKDEIEHECKLKEMNERLASSFPSSFIEEFVICDEQNDCVIFPFNTLLEGAERKKASKELSNAISKRGEVSFTIEVPIRWFALELQLEKKAELRGFISKEEAIAEGERLNMTGIDVERALKYLHNCTIILYYPEVEPQLVFLKPQVIIDVLSHLLVLKYRKDKLVRLLAESVTSKETTDIARHGKFRETLLEKLDKFTGEFTPKYFINLLNHLHIIAELPKDATTGEQTYFLPCALPPYETSTFEIPVSTIKPLRLLWRKEISRWESTVTVCVPRGSFHLMIVHLLKQKRYKVILSSQSQQYRNAVTLLVSFLPPRKEKFYIVNRNKYLEITYIGSQGYCPALLELVKVAVKESVAAINVSCGELCTAFACLEDGNCIVDEEGEPMECPDAKGHSYCKPFNDDRYLCWFKNSDSVATPTVTSNGDRLPGGTTILNESHKPLILEALRKVVSQWKRIGIQLGIEKHELEAIEYNRRYQVENQVQDCRKDMVNLWIKTGTATKQRLIEALEAEGLQEDADELK